MNPEGGSGGWRLRLGRSVALQQLVRFLGLFVPPVAWVFVGLTLQPSERARITPAGRRFLDVAAVVVPAGSLGVLVLAVWAFAWPPSRSAVIPVLVLVGGMTFAFAIGVRTIVIRAVDPAPEPAPETRRRPR